jgi:hypothetical protein
MRATACGWRAAVCALLNSPAHALAAHVEARIVVEAQATLCEQARPRRGRLHDRRCVVSS